MQARSRNKKRQKRDSRRFVTQRQQAARLRNKVWEHGSNGEEAMQKAFKTKTILQLQTTKRTIRR